MSTFHKKIPPDSSPMYWKWTNEDVNMLFGRRTQKQLGWENHWWPFIEKCFHLCNLSALLKRTQGTLRFWTKKSTILTHRPIFKYVPNRSVTYYTCVVLLNEKNEFIQLYKEKTQDRHCCLHLPHRKPQEKISQSLLRGAVTGWQSVDTHPKWEVTVRNIRKKICSKSS